MAFSCDSTQPAEAISALRGIVGDAITPGYLCQSLNIQDYFLGETDPTMRLLLENHLPECEECVAELISLQRVQALLRLAFGDPSDYFESSRPGNRPQMLVPLKTGLDVATN